MRATSKPGKNKYEDKTQMFSLVCNKVYGGGRLFVICLGLNELFRVSGCRLTKKRQPCSGAHVSKYFGKIECRSILCYTVLKG